MYLGIGIDDKNRYKLPGSQAELIQNVSNLLQPQSLNKIKAAYRKKMGIHRDDQPKRILFSNLYYLFRCSQFKSEAQLLVLIVINNDFKRLDSILAQTSQEQTKQIVNKSFHGFTLIYFSARAGHREPMRVLIKHGYKFNITNQFSSPVHAATYFNQKEILKLLIDLGAPTNLKNKFGDTPDKDTQDKEMIKIIENAYKNDLDKLNFSLSSQGKGNGKLRIFYNGQLIGQKIILSNYEHKSYNRIKTFQGTQFKYLEHIATKGFKRTFDMYQERKEEACQSISQKNQGQFNTKELAFALFSSPSILEAASPVFTKTFQIQVDGNKQSWDPILQLRVKQGFFGQFVKIVKQKHESIKYNNYSLKGFFDDVKEAIVSTLSKDPTEVQALIFIKSGFLGKQKLVEQMNKLFLESEDQKYFLLKN